MRLIATYMRQERDRKSKINSPKRVKRRTLLTKSNIKLKHRNLLGDVNVFKDEDAEMCYSFMAFKGYMKIILYCEIKIFLSTVTILKELTCILIENKKFTTI